MKFKIIFLLLSFYWLSVSAQAQVEIDYTGSAYLDAVTIYNYLQSNPNATAEEINTALQPILSNDNAGIYSDWKANNPFLKDHFIQPAVALYYQMKDNGAFILKGDAIAPQGLGLSSLTGIDVTQYVQAFADFLRDRISQELTIAYMKKLNQALNTPPIPDLLPATLQVFHTTDPFQIPSMGPTYKAAIAKDLASLPQNFENYVMGNLYSGLLDPEKNAFVISASLYDIASQCGKGYLPVDALNTASLKYNFDAAHPNQATYLLAVLNMFSQNLRSADGKGWVDRNDLRAVNPQVLRFFFALMYSKNSGLFNDTHNYLGTHTLLAIFADSQTMADRVAEFLTLAGNITQKLQTFTTSTSQLTTYADQKQAAVDIYLGFADMMPQLVQFVLSLDKNNQYNTVVNNLLSLAQNGVEIGEAVHTNNLPQAVNGSVKVIETVIGGPDNNMSVKKFIDIVTFVSDLATADSSAQIKAVLDHYAAPVESYLTIRQSKFSVTLGAYPGIYIGTELNGNAGVKIFNYAAFGVTAPVGLAFSTGAADATKSSSSWSLFLSAVDIGAALSYSTTSGNSSIPGKITLGQIFSPGAHLVYGFKDSPLAIKVGYQYSPQLRDLTANGSTLSDAGVWRLSLGLVVDIPLFIITSSSSNDHE